MVDLDTMERLAPVMINFNRFINRSILNDLRRQPLQVYAEYVGYLFGGYVFNNGDWVCQVWQYGLPVKEIEAGTPEELMTLVSNEFGDR